MMAALFVLGYSNFASGAISINEMSIDPPGADGGHEFVEFYSSTGGVESLAGLHFLSIESDFGGMTAGTTMGRIDKAVDLGSFSTGSNGLFLLKNSTTALSPAPEAATTVDTSALTGNLENGSNAFLLVMGFTGSAGDDLDTDDDGSFDTTPWTSVIDSISLVDGGTNDASYGSEVLPVGGYIQVPMGPNIGGDVNGANPGPYDIDGTVLTPGRLVIPEPSAFLLCALAGLLGLTRRR